MALSTKNYKGTRDFYPEDMRLRNWMFNIWRSTVESFGYEEYDAPILESLELYTSKTSDEIVNEQSFSFEDRGGRRVIMRPEMTPSVSRMVAGRRQELGYPLRLYSIPNCFRYERQQRGRLREFWQLNIDLFGAEGSLADFEIILLADEIMKAFGADAGMYEIKISSIKCLNKKLDEFGLASGKSTEVKRLIDKKAKMPDEDFTHALKEITNSEITEKIINYLNSTDMPVELMELFDYIKDAGIESAIYDPSIVRGFDYYTDVVFEVYDKNPDNNRAMFGGGRYDGLVAMFGVEPLPTIGFGVGDVTFQNFLEANNLVPKLKPSTDVCVIAIGSAKKEAYNILNMLRKSSINTSYDFTDRKIDKKIKSVVKQNIKYALFVGEKELQSKSYVLKNLENSDEASLTIDEVISKIKTSN